jgi:hypothetical protein
MSVARSDGKKPNRIFPLDYQPIYAAQMADSTLSGSEFDMGKPR